VEEVKISNKFAATRAKQLDVIRKANFERKFAQNERRMAQKERLWKEKKELLMKLFKTDDPSTSEYIDICGPRLSTLFNLFL
jgi:hypothetical protein